jgi:hypothetical protein
MVLVEIYDDRPRVALVLDQAAAVRRSTAESRRSERGPVLENAIG